MVLKIYFQLDDHKRFGRINDNSKIKKLGEDLESVKKIYKTMPHFLGEWILDQILADLTKEYPGVYKAVAEKVYESIIKHENEFQMRPP